MVGDQCQRSEIVITIYALGDLIMAQIGAVGVKIVTWQLYY